MMPSSRLYARGVLVSTIMNDGADFTSEFGGIFFHKQPHSLGHASPPQP